MSSDKALTVVASKPLPDLSVTNSSPLPSESAGGAGADTDAVTFGGMQRNRDPELNAEVAKTGATMVGAAVAPELLPEMGGTGLLNFLARIFAKSGATGAGAGVGNTAGQILSGQNPISKGSLKESGEIAAGTAALSAPLEAIGAIPFTKAGRAFINKSLGATARDVTYGNPAVAITKNEITDLGTGDFEAYKNALRQGKSEAEASAAAGGRFAAVSQRINELTPRLERVLSNSPAKIPVDSVIVKPLDDSMMEVITNPALTSEEKDAAFNKLYALKQSLTQGLGQDITPVQAQAIKQAIGGRVRWGSTIAVTDDVAPAYRKVYSALKNANHASVPGAGPIDENLTNLLAARGDLEALAKSEEVSPNAKLGVHPLLGAVESGIGKVLPSAIRLTPFAPPASAGIANIGEQLQSKGQNVPGLPFHPGAGIPKP